MKITRTIATFIALTASPALAESPTEIADWSGAFAGFAFGYGAGDSELMINGLHEGIDPSIDGGFAGLYGGYDWQRGQNVFGLDASYNASGIKGEETCPNSSYTCSTEIEDFGALRGRYGRILNNGALIYGAAGFAFANVNTNADDGSGPVFQDPNASLKGWTAALGFQKMLRSGWAMRGEISHTDYGTTDPGDINDSSSDTLELDVKFTSLTFGFERRF